MQHETGQNAADQRHPGAMPPHDAGRSVDETDRLAGEQNLEKTNAFAEDDAGERPTDADQGSPEYDAGKVFVSEQKQSEPRQK